MARELRAEVATVTPSQPRRLRPLHDPADGSGHQPASGVAPHPGDATAGARSFDDLYQSEWSAMVALGWSLTGSWTTAEELAQDAFTDAYRRWATLSTLDRPGTWLRRAVINRSASYHRHRSVEQRGLQRWSARDQLSQDEGHSDRTGDTATDQIGDPAFWAAVQSLPDRQLACAALHYLEDQPVAEIAKILQCRPATVKVHLHRGRQTLAQLLAADDAPPSAGHPEATPPINLAPVQDGGVQ